jgi:hypothetical protein
VLSLSLPAADDVPTALLAQHNWLTWRAEQRGERITKLPVSPRTGRLASSTDSATWTTFAAAVSFAVRERCDGVGFVFTATPFVGIDLDHCLDLTIGELAPWAVRIMERFSTYTEISPSGTGLHLILRGALPAGGRKRPAEDGASGGAVEVYDDGRYFTFTGRRWPSTPLAIEDRQEELQRWYAEAFPQEQEREVGQSPPPAPHDVSDAALVRLASAAQNGSLFASLWAGRWQDTHASQSEADLALCNLLAFWTGGDAARVDALFRQSGLLRPKWDERHRGDGRTYGQLTVEKALASTTSYYEGPALEVDTRKETKASRNTNTKRSPIESIDAAALLTTRFPVPRYAVPGLLPEGASLLAGKPKQGKSFLALSLALAVATDGLALGKIEVDGGDVLYLALEDGPRRIQRRLNDMLDEQAPPGPGRLTLATRWPLLDEGGIDSIEAWLVAHPRGRLVVIDTLARVKPEEQRGKGAYSQDYAAIAPLADLAQAHSVSIVIVTHLRKQESDDPMELISGTLALAGAVDGTLVMRRERGAPDAALYVFDRDAEDKTLALHWDIGNGGWTLMGDAAEYKRSKQRNEILALVHDLGGSVAPKDVAAYLNRPRPTIRWLMTTMAQSGELINAGGVYLAQAPRPDGVPSFIPTPPTPTGPNRPQQAPTPLPHSQRERP